MFRVLPDDPVRNMCQYLEARVGRQAQRFTQELKALYAAAGSPQLSEIVARGGQKPPLFNDASLSEWLNNAVVPSNIRTFAALTALLENLAEKRPGHIRRSTAEWEELRAAARAEKQSGRSRRTAGTRSDNTPSESEDARLLGVPIGQCDPIDLEVHPAGESGSRETAKTLPRYVRRAHDNALARVVAKAAGGASAMAVLVGSSSTGKTRACWEAIQELAASGWRLWHPVDPSPADAALAGIAALGPRTVVWLNEAQHYLKADEHLAAALHTLLTDPARGPVLVLATLWPEYDHAYAREPKPSEKDPYERVRKLLASVLR